MREGPVTCGISNWEKDNLSHRQFVEERSHFILSFGFIQGNLLKRIPIDRIRSMLSQVRRLCRCKTIQMTSPSSSRIHCPWLPRNWIRYSFRKCSHESTCCNSRYETCCEHVSSRPICLCQERARAPHIPCAHNLGFLACFGVNLDKRIPQVITTRHTPASLLSEHIQNTKSPPKQKRHFICTERKGGFELPGSTSFTS